MKKYRVTQMNGDYADLTDENGEKVFISVFLLPENINVGDVLAYENFEYCILPKEA